MPVPPRAAGFRPKKADVLNDSVLDEATRQLLLQDLARRRPPPTSAAKATPPSTTDVPPESEEDALVTVMAQRIAGLEKQNKMQMKELREKMSRVAHLEAENDRQRATLESAQLEKQLLAERLAQMNQFLADYGLTFVGESSRGTSPQADDNAPSPPKFDLYAGAFNPSAAQPPGEAPQEPMPDQRPETVTAAAAATQPAGGLPFSLAELIAQAEKLTYSLSKNVMATDGNRGLIKERDTVYVCVYADGIVVNSGLFRPYGWPLCDALLHDVLEGYYPYEFKDKYPDGFPIEIVDKSGDKCPRKGDDSNVRTVGDHGYKPLTREALLARLPQQYVTKEGKLINLRGGVNDFIGGQPASDVTPSGPQHVEAQTAAVRASASDADAAKIMVKFPQGHSVALRMFRTDTIAQLRADLLAAAAGFFAPTCSWELVSAYPRKTLDAHDDTLSAADLVPSAALQVKLLV